MVNKKRHGWSDRKPNAMRGKGKGKKVKFTPEQATEAQRGSRSIALLFFSLGTR